MNTKRAEEVGWVIYEKCGELAGVAIAARIEKGASIEDTTTMIRRELGALLLAEMRKELEAKAADVALAIKAKRQKHAKEMEGRWHSAEYDDGLSDAANIAVAAILREE